MKNIFQILTFLIIIAFAAFAGVWIGQNIITTKNINYENQDTNNFHYILHSELNVTKEQDKQLSEIEKEYVQLKTLYQSQMKTANIELAQAIKKNGYESPETEKIIHKIHSAMGKLQFLSLKHLADMQKILSEEQNQKLQEMVIEQLMHNAGE